MPFACVWFYNQPMLNSRIHNKFRPSVAESEDAESARFDAMHADLMRQLEAAKVAKRNAATSQNMNRAMMDNGERDE